MATLDHVVINARDDMDRAADIYRRLGFTLTERGYHSLGSMNHLAMFGTDYLELIAVPKGATSGRIDLLDFPVRPQRPGVRLGGLGRHLRLAFQGRRAGRSAGRVHAAGQGRRQGARCALPHRSHEGGVVPYGRVYYCHHFTRDLVWRDEWRHHANGTVAVAARADRRARSGGGRQALCRHVRPGGGARHQGRQDAS